MIETNDLSKQFNNDFWAVNGVTLNVQPGKILALLGQNGAGKTTTVRMLTALLRPTRGWARVAGYDVTKNPKEVRSNVGVLTEQHGLYMRMTGEEYLEFFGKVYGLDPKARKARGDYLLQYFGIGEAAQRRCGEYSKGMKQKLALARALIHDPSVLLLDEPSMGLAPTMVEVIFQTIQEINRQGTTILLVEQNALMALEVAHRGYVLQTGRTVLHDTAANLLQNATVRKVYLGID